jgi:putative ABC transport system permease protein
VFAARDISVVASLAITDFAYERRMSVCLVIALAAVLAPLLVLFGLRYGIVSTLRDELRRNPTTLELRPLTQSGHGAAFFAELRALPGVGFVIPTTRFLAATINLHSARQGDADSVEVEMLPTAVGDPLLASTLDQELPPDRVVLSRSAAEKLKVSPGDVVEGRVGRVVGESLEWMTAQLGVRAVLPVGAFAGDAAFVDLGSLVAVEDYREGRAGVPLGAPADEPAPDRIFASFRLYARSIDDVEALRGWLVDRGIDTSTKLSEIRLVQRLDRNLIVLFAVVAGLGGFGFALSLTISLWATVERKRYELSVLRLLGLPSAALALFPVVQAGLTAIAGSALAGLLYAGAAPLINTLFAEGLTASQILCRLPPASFGEACLLTIVLSLLASSVAGLRATRFLPADGLRRE